MTIIEDSRQQVGKHELKHQYFVQNRVRMVRSKIAVGDYCRPPAVSIDTKASMDEIAQNIGGSHEEHKRFINELKLAQDIGTKLYVLVENTSGIESIEDVHKWHNPREVYSPKCIQGEQLAKAMHTIEDRYGCTFMFCRPDEAAEVIIDLLR